MPMGGGLGVSSSDSGRYGGGTTGTTGQGFGGSTASHYSGGTSTSSSAGSGGWGGSGSRAAGGAADRSSVSGYSGESTGGYGSGSAGRAAGGAADRGSVSGYSGSGGGGGGGYQGGYSHTGGPASPGGYSGYQGGGSGAAPSRSVSTAGSGGYHVGGAGSSPANFGGAPATASSANVSSRIGGVGGAVTGIGTGGLGSTTGARIGFGTGTVMDAIRAGISADMYKAAANTENNAARAALAEQARRVENSTMDTYTGMRAAMDKKNAAAVQQYGQSRLEGQALDRAPTEYGKLASSMRQVGVADLAGQKQGITREMIGPVIDRMLSVESTDNPYAKNPMSSATGLGQFTKGTWVATMKENRPDLTKNKTDDEIAAMRFDPALSREMTEDYALKNAQAIAENGLPVTPSAIYGAHFLGPGGYIAAAKADPNARAVNVLGSKVVNANPSVMGGATIGDVLGFVDKKMAGVDFNTGQTVAATTGSDKEARAHQASIDAREKVRQDAIANGLDPQDRSIQARQDEAAAAAYDAVMNEAQTGTQEQQASNAAAAARDRALQEGKSEADAEQAAKDAYAAVMNGTTPAPATTQSTTTTPATTVPAPTIPATNKPNPNYRRGLGGYAAAAGIDMLVPAPFQIAALLATGNTVGGAVVDAMGGRYGPNNYQPGGPQSPGSVGNPYRSGSESGAATYSNIGTTTEGGLAQPTSTSTTTDTGSTTTPAADFIHKYIDNSGAFEGGISVEPVTPPVYDWIPKQATGIRPFSWERAG